MKRQRLNRTDLLAIQLKMMTICRYKKAHLNNSDNLNKKGKVKLIRVRSQIF